MDRKNKFSIKEAEASLQRLLLPALATGFIVGATRALVPVISLIVAIAYLAPFVIGLVTKKTWEWAIAPWLAVFFVVTVDIFITTLKSPGLIGPPLSVYFTSFPYNVVPVVVPYYAGIASVAIRYLIGERLRK